MTMRCVSDRPGPTRGIARRSKALAGVVFTSTMLAGIAGCGDASADHPDTPEALAAAIADKLGDSNFGVPRLVVNKLDPDGTYEVRWQINDNLTQGMVHTGAKDDIFNVIQIIKASKVPVTQLQMTGGYPLTDPYGNSVNQTVIQVDYSGATIAKINTDNIAEMEDILTVADQSDINPNFQ